MEFSNDQHEVRRISYRKRFFALCKDIFGMCKPFAQNDVAGLAECTSYGALSADNRKSAIALVNGTSSVALSADNRKCAFTLAEVLITLGIIGIVAAMTLPTLINNHRDKELITRVKKTYTAINQALILAQEYYGTPGSNAALFANGKSSAQVTQEFSKFFNGARFCQAGSNASGCKHLNYKIKFTEPHQSGNSNSAAMGSMTSYPRIVLNDGAVLALNTLGHSCEAYTTQGAIYNSDGSLKRNPDGSLALWTQTRNNCGIIVFDVNGAKNPNQFGRDAYTINVFESKVGNAYWGVYGTTSLNNILLGKTNPFVYKNYSENDVFEW